MKKLFTLTTLLVLAMTVNAQETYRKSWDFTKWSATTEAQIKGSSDWTNDEKGDGTSNVVPDNACVWNVGANVAAACDENGYLKAGDAVIPELEGLKWTNLAAKKIAIAFDYQTTTDTNKWGPYKGGAYLWLNGKTTAVHFSIPGVEPGTTIKMGVESHKPSDARGVDLLVGGTKVTAVEPTGYPTTYQEYTWTIPGEPGDELVEVDVQPSNGCHIYYITVGDGGQTVDEAKNVAYIHNGGLDEDLAYVMLSGDNRFNVTAIDVATAPTYTSLTEGGYEVAVIAPSVSAESAAALKGLIAFFPVVNLNANLYSAWGYGSAAPFEETTLTKAAGNAYADAIFEGIESATYDGNITAVSLGDYFANDEILAVAGPATAIHAHNPGRNAYYYVPSDNMSEVIYGSLIPNVVLAAAKTKKTVTAAGTPAISFTQGDGVSTVTITSSNSSAIYYTTDGSDPKTAGTAYTEPFDLTADATVKAYAAGADGYLDSEVSEKQVTIATQAAVPTISVAQEAGKTTVTLSSDADGAKIYFNCDGSKTAALSQAYKEPIVFEEPATIYALVEIEGKLPSELVSQAVEIQSFDRTNEVAHFDANETDWLVDNSADGGTGSAKAYYYWGNKADSWNAVKTINPNKPNGWVLKSQGQVFTGELNVAAAAGVGNGATGYYAEEALDYITTPTKGKMTFGGKLSNTETETYEFTCRIETTDQLQAPLDVVVIAANGNGPSSIPGLEIQVSEDGETWNKVGDVKMANTQRYIKRTRVSYNEEKKVYVRVAQTGGGSKAQVHDIYVYNKPATDPTGISTVESKQSVAADGIYNINGVRMQQLQRGLNIVKTADGQVKKLMVK